MKNLIKQSLLICIVMAAICGLIYPLAITGIGNILFHKQANGSMISYNNKDVGSELLGQNFSSDGFFHGRVSSINYNTYTEVQKKNGATGYTGVTSGSSNLAPSNKQLTDRIAVDVAAFIKRNPSIKKSGIPADLVTNSGSGLDPDISVEAAMIQIPRISKSTGINTVQLQAIIASNTIKRQLGIFGEERVNFVKCNIEIAKQLYQMQK